MPLDEYRDPKERRRLPWDPYFPEPGTAHMPSQEDNQVDKTGGQPLTQVSEFFTAEGTPSGDGEGEGEGEGGAGGYFPGSRAPRARPIYNIKPAPMFTAPIFSYPDKFSFSGPDLANEPGYQFRLNQGLKALDQSAAARGNLRTGGQIKAFNDYSQNYAAQEYENAWSRALGAYNTNYGVARDVFDRKYTGAKDEYAPRLFEWQTLTAAEQRAADLELQNLWAQWMHENASADSQLSVLAGMAE